MSAGRSPWITCVLLVLVGAAARFGVEFALDRPTRRVSLRPLGGPTTRAPPDEQRPAVHVHVDGADEGGADGPPEREPDEAAPDNRSEQGETSLSWLEELRRYSIEHGVPTVYDRAFARHRTRPLGFNVREVVDAEVAHGRSDLRESMTEILARFGKRNVAIPEVFELNRRLSAIQVIAIWGRDGRLDVVYGGNRGAPDVIAEDQARAFARLAGEDWDQLDSSRQAKTHAGG